MLDIGFSKILVIAALALIVLGPDKLPQVARTIGRWAGRARAMARQFRDQLETEAEGLNLNPKVTPTPAPSAEPAPSATPAPAASAPADGSASTAAHAAEAPAIAPAAAPAPPPTPTPPSAETPPHDRGE